MQTPVLGVRVRGCEEWEKPAGGWHMVRADCTKANACCESFNIPRPMR